MIPRNDIFDAAQRNSEVYYMNYLGDGLYTLQMEDDRNNGIPPQKMNSYGVLKVIDPTWKKQRAMTVIVNYTTI